MLLDLSLSNEMQNPICVLFAVVWCWLKDFTSEYTPQFYVNQYVIESDIFAIISFEIVISDLY
jgi:hypothetical protein